MTSRMLVPSAFALVAATVGLLSVLVAGTIGLVVVMVAGSALGLAMIRARLGSDPRWPRESRRRPAPSWPVAPFHAYRRIEFFLTWAPERPTPGRRSLLTRLCAAVLADRRGIDLHRDPEAARRVLGESAWALIDPQHDTPTGTEEIASLVDRLEQL
ncbi:MAG TPA: hypothetical protein VHF06_33505 [Pseudonocardiaceae bacterium]|nr:hypothetical protein [Pseudonocardiaceae bacterium]